MRKFRVTTGPRQYGRRSGRHPHPLRCKWSVVTHPLQNWRVPPVRGASTALRLREELPPRFSAWAGPGNFAGPPPKRPGEAEGGEANCPPQAKLLEPKIAETLCH